MNYAERIAELKYIEIELQDTSSFDEIVQMLARRIVELSAAWDADGKHHTEWDGYSTHPADTMVFRNPAGCRGALVTGRVIAPTSADVERCFAVHGVPGKRDPMVYVQWGVNRTWEYTRDLRVVQPSARNTVAPNEIPDNPV